MSLVRRAPSSGLGEGAGRGGEGRPVPPSPPGQVQQLVTLPGLICSLRLDEHLRDWPRPGVRFVRGWEETLNKCSPNVETMGTPHCPALAE